MESKYLKAFQALKSTCPTSYRTIGDGIWVEEVREEEIKTASGLIISSGEKKQLNSIQADMPMMVWVLDTGEGYYDDETKEDVPLEVRPGCIAIIPKLSVTWVSTFGGIITADGPKLGFTRESEIRHYWKGIEEYNLYFGTLRKELGL